MANDAKSRSNRLIWIDCEMSGLNLDRHTIVEIACVVTEGDLKVVAEGPNLVISPGEGDVLETMSEWCKLTFSKNGLLERIRLSTLSMNDAEQQILSFVREHTDKGVCALAGNTVHQDRRYIDKYMPLLGEHFHYRNVDVSTFKEVARRWYPEIYSEHPKKKKGHRALDDILESIEELRWYKMHIFK